MPAADSAPVPEVSIDALADRYDVFLLDAFGVLVDAAGALTGAAALIDRLRAAGKRFFVVTNDASRLPETSAQRFRDVGLAVTADQVITSGSLIAPYFRAHALAGARCMVLGPKDSQRYVADAGGRVVPPAAGEAYDAVVVCDDAGYPFLGTLDVAMSALFRHIDAGRCPHLILPNPDLIYPAGRSDYGFTSGAVAMLLEAALTRRYRDLAPSFVRLGKPFSPIFDEARRRAGPGRLLMIGDQLETDIAGARAAGIDAALLTTGISRWKGDLPPEAARPTYLLAALA